MSGKARAQIIEEIENHIAKVGGSYGEWYVGVSDNPKHTLLNVHKLRTTGDAWIARKAIDDLQAAEVEEFFRTVLKTKGQRIAGSMDHIFVYAYRMKTHTRP